METNKTVVFVFIDGTTKKFDLCSSIKGLRDSKNRRAIKAMFNFSKDAELTRIEKEQVYNSVIPSLDPIIGEVLYDNLYAK